MCERLDVLLHARRFQGTTGVIDQSAKTIALEVPFGTDLATLAPTFTLSSGTCDQPNDGTTPPDPTFAVAPGNTVDYVVTDTSTDPDTVNTYAVTITVAPQIATLVIDLGTSPAGTTIAGGTFGTYVAAPGFPTNLPLPSLPLGSILRRIDVNVSLEAPDNGAYASDLTVLLDPSPGTPGGDFSLGITGSSALEDFGPPTKTLVWASSGTGGVGDSFNEFKDETMWSGDIGDIDLATTGLFLGNAFSTGDGTWSGKITLTYEVSSGGGNNFSDWIAGYFPGETDPAIIGLDADPDGDGNDNGVENFFGTAPDEFTQGLVSGTVDTGANTFTFTHPLNATPADDLTATYRWSTDLQTFHDDGDPNGAGTTTVDFVQGAPSAGMVTVTATISGTEIPDKLFVDVEVTQP